MTGSTLIVWVRVRRLWLPGQRLRSASASASSGALLALAKLPAVQGLVS